MSSVHQRLVDAHEHSLLTEDEVARTLRFSVKTLDRLVDRGDFPEALENSDRGRVWSWRDVLWYQMGMELRNRLRTRKGQAGSGGGQEETKS